MATAIEKKREVRIAQEGSYLENALTPGSITWTVSSTVLRPKVFSIDTTGLKRSAEADKVVLTDLRQHKPMVPTVTSGSKLKMQHYFTGYGSSGATAAYTRTELGTLLTWFLGGETETDGTTQAGAGATTTVLNLTTATSYVAGAYTFVGSELRRITAKSGSDITLHQALAGAPASLTPIYGVGCYYPTEAMPTSMRIAVIGDTNEAEDQIICFGCTPAALRISGLAPGQVPVIEFEFDVAYWVQGARSLTFTTTAFLDKDAKPVGSGGLFFNESGTTTRNVIQETDFTFEAVLSAVKDPSSAGAGSNSLGLATAIDCQGYVRDDVGAKFGFKTNFSISWYTRWRSSYSTAWNLLRQNQSTAGAGTGIGMMAVYPGDEPKRDKIGDKTGQMISGFADRPSDATGITTDVAYAPFHLLIF